MEVYEVAEASGTVKPDIVLVCRKIDLAAGSKERGEWRLMTGISNVYLRRDISTYYLTQQVQPP